MSATGSLWDAVLGKPYSIVPDELAQKCMGSVWKWITRIFRNRTTGLRIAVKYLARLAGFSVRQVYRVLDALEEKGVIRRTPAPLDRGVGGLTSQTIDILVRVIPPTDRVRKPRSDKGNGPKKFAPTGDISVTCRVTEVSPVPSFEGYKNKNSNAGVVDEGDGTPSPPPAKVPETEAEARSVWEAAAKAARAAQARSAPPRPVESPHAPPVTPRADIRLAMVRDVEAFGRMAAEGDAVAAAELPFVRARLEQHDAKYPPAADPPGVGSAPPIADPPA